MEDGAECVESRLGLARAQVLRRPTEVVPVEVRHLLIVWVLCFVSRS